MEDKPSRVARASVALASFAIFLWGMYFTMFAPSVTHKISASVTMLTGFVIFAFVMAASYTIGNGDNGNYR